MTFSRLRLLIQHLFLILSLFAGKFGLSFGGQALPCLTCSLVMGGCNGCLIRFIQFYLIFLSGPGAIFGAEGLGFLKAIIVVIVLTILLGRLWCGWLCPFGLVQDWLSAIGRKLRLGPHHLSKRAESFFKSVKYILLLVVFLVPPLIELGYIHQDFFYAFCQICPSGVILPLLAGQPGRVAVNFASSPSILITFISMALTGCIVSLTLFIHRPWCRLCPLTVFHSLFKKFRLIDLKRQPELCSSCRKCQKVCPLESTIDLKKNTIKDCLGCGQCLKACPKAGCLSLKVASKLTLISSGPKQMARCD
ncbi:MAG: 4Fe-4S binding protein [Deltaproteobacteria bacterium]|jgi:polyferredoxin|nr:4Fe-4S binding protein [Deltaproteobacteria bacterium]